VTAGGRRPEPLGYRLVRRLARVLLALFYHRIELVGAERIPGTGPLVVTANHQNALVDPALLLATVPRRLRPLAKAPLFRYPLIGWLLRLAGAIPVHRRQDPGSDPAQNAAMFATATATLAAGGAILIFPEGVSQSEPRLMPLRTGAARIALGAPGTTLLPVGLVYHEPGTFRTGWALVLVGPPVPIGDCAASYATDPEAAVRRLTERVGEALRPLIVEAQDRTLLRLLGAAETIWRAEAATAGDPATRTAWMQAALRAYRHHLGRDPGRVEALAHAVERFAKDLEASGLAPGGLAAEYPAPVVLRYALREGAALLLGLPLAVWGLVNHGLPYQLTRLTVRLLRPDPDSEATYKLLAGLVFYPGCWAAEGWLARRLGGGLGLGAFLASLGPTGFFALGWWERLRRVRRDARGFFQFLARRDLHARLLERRQGLLAELRALAREAPDRTLAGRGPDPG
jgi:glycerol-3-phosphate O-acyltransferase/dihydroxyacetone phosphate acyltransferase